MIYFAGDKPGIGFYQCECENIIELTSDDQALPLCPRCGHGEYEKIKHKPKN